MMTMLMCLKELQRPLELEIYFFLWLLQVIMSMNKALKTFVIARSMKELVVMFTRRI